MNISLRKSELISYITASILGVLFHFVYEWSGNNSFLGLFVPVNESTWEHLKLIFFPIVILSLIEYFLFSIKKPAFICIKLRSTLIGMFATVVLFYTYSGILGKTIDVVNIAIYFIAMTISYCYSFKQLKKESNSESSSQQCFLVLCIIILLFAYLTIFPLPIGLFKPPVI